MDWIRVRLSDEQMANGKPLNLQEWYASRFMASGSPIEAPLYTRIEPDGMDYYFPPKAVEIATIEALQKMGGEACEKPQRDGICVAVANGDAFKLLD